VSAHDPKLHEPPAKLEALEARLAAHEKTTRRGLMWLSAIGLMALALPGYVAAHL